MGIRQTAMCPEPEKKEPEYSGYQSYPYDGYNQRYDGNYDGSKYKEEIEPERDRTDTIIINLVITYREMGKGYFDNDNIAYDTDKAEIKVKEIAYDKITSLIGKGFESKYSIIIEPSDGYDQYDVEIILTPLTKNE